MLLISKKICGALNFVVMADGRYNRCRISFNFCETYHEIHDIYTLQKFLHVCTVTIDCNIHRLIAIRAVITCVQTINYNTPQNGFCHGYVWFYNILCLQFIHNFMHTLLYGCKNLVMRLSTVLSDVASTHFK